MPNAPRQGHPGCPPGSQGPHQPLKILRYLLRGLAALAVLAAALALSALVPFVQTWAAQFALNRTPGMHASIGSVAAGFGEVDVDEARLEYAGAVLTVPTLRAHLPVFDAVWSRRPRVASLVARGWTLDLTHGSGPGGAGRPALRSAADAEPLVLAALRTWRLPFDGTWEGVDLDGDILLAGQDPASPIQVHLAIKGGGIAAGREARFDVDAAVVGAQIPSAFTFAKGAVSARIGPARNLERLALKADFMPSGEPNPDTPDMSLEASVERASHASSCMLDVMRGPRHLATVRADAADAAQRLTGAWRLDLRDSDVAAFGIYAGLPPMAAAGGGRFDADAPLTRVHAQGHLEMHAGRLGARVPVLGRLPTLKVGADFDATADGRSVRITRLSLTAGGSEPIIALRTLQPLDLSLESGRISASAAAGGLVAGSLRAFPLALLTEPTARLGFEKGTASGDFTVRAENGSYALELARPIEASGVSLLGPGRLLGGGLSFTLPLSAHGGRGTWGFDAGPVAVLRDGRAVGSLQAKASRGGAGQPIAASGAWSLDMAAAGAAAPGMPLGRTASGEFTASIADVAEVACKLKVIGHDPGRSVTMDAHAEVDGDGDFTYTASARVALGAEASAVSAEGGLSFSEDETRVEGKVEGDDVALAHLALLARALCAAQAGTGRAAARAALPAWGSLVGQVEFSFKRLRTADDAYEGVAGTITLRNDSAQLGLGRVWLLQHDLARFYGIISFDPSKAPPYGLTATLALDDADASAFFGKAKADELAPVEGHFAISGTVASEGSDLPGLLRNMSAQVHVQSTNGIVRLLKVNIADAIPESPSRVSDTLGSVGATVGSLFGIKSDPAKFGRNDVSKADEALLSFTYDISEIGYDTLQATARIGPDGSMHLSDIDVTAPNAHLSGSGDIAYAKGLPFAGRPLSLVLTLGLRGDPQKLMGAAGLLSADKDAKGYALLKQPLALGGTLAQIDATPWHDLLAAAAVRAAAGKNAK